MLLDTTILVDALRRRPAVIARLRQATGSFLALAISVDELLFGMRPGEEERTGLLIDGLEVVPVGLPEARLALDQAPAAEAQDYPVKPCSAVDDHRYFHPGCATSSGEGPANQGNRSPP